MSDKLLNVVMFSGGRGTTSIASALLEHSQVQLTLLVNTYDDGLSTGALRRFIPGMLGPSDVRKNVSLLMEDADLAQQALRKLIEFRFPKPSTRAGALAALEALATMRRPNPNRELNDAVAEISLRQAEFIGLWLKAYLDYARQQKSEFDYSDCSLGNLFFAGCYLGAGRSFNDAVREFSRECRLRGNVLNVTDGENLVLTAIKNDGAILFDEASIVSVQNDVPIDDLYLLPSYLDRAEWERKSPQDRRRGLDALSRTPRPNPEALKAIESADVVIYGPGTQHSSLFPSYLTDGVAEAIAANAAAEKIFVCNIYRDNEIQGETAESIARKFLRYMNRKGKLSQPWERYVGTFLLQNPATLHGVASKYVPVGEASAPFSGGDVRISDWEHAGGTHAGFRVLDELIAIVNTKLQKKLKPFHHTVSIVVPALNEERTVQKVLWDLSLLNFEPLGIGKEIIFVDGGSTDRSLELAQSVRDVRTFRLEGQSGRGAALRLGIEKATGDIIAFFHSDGEYRAEDLIPVVQGITANGFRAVYGSRAIKCVNLSERIHDIYKGSYAMYLVSKYGGILFSVLGLLLYNRFVSDALTGVKAFEARLLRELKLKTRGFEIETELLAKLGRRGVFILEIPIGYQPRTRSQGKKSTVWDGLRALFRLIAARFTPE
ncbi:MAG: YvcK family protein [Elusimicrobia bacterium]|nr:YvcK family protein [Elusimicrobiota bacterium]